MELVGRSIGVRRGIRRVGVMDPGLGAARTVEAVSQLV